MTTLCAGCGHDSITAAIVQAFWELSIPPHRVAKLSGIGCSSKTPAYFLKEAHGFNGVHGRMPALATGANAANGDLIYIGVSGDGDSLSIGLGQLSHAIRRNVNLLYVLENNGVYGLTKGQFSASADRGSLSKKGEANTMESIDGCLLALTLGATFVARSFSGDKAQLVPILKAGLAHRRLRVHRRHLAVRHVQRSRGLDQELRLHARAQRRDRAGRFRPAGGGDHDRLRGGQRPQRDDARRQLGAPAQGGARTTTPPIAIAPTPTSASGRRTARSSPACSIISPDSQDMHAQSDTIDVAARRPAVRAALPGERRAAEDAAAVPVTT